MGYLESIECWKALTENQVGLKIQMIVLGLIPEKKGEEKPSFGVRRTSGICRISLYRILEVTKGRVPLTCWKTCECVFFLSFFFLPEKESASLT